MNQIDDAEKLLQLTEEGTSPFHVTASVERQLQKAGFQKVELGENWKLEKGGRYYLPHHGSSLLAFTIGKDYRNGDGFRIAAAHTDFPGLRIKPASEVKKAGYRQLNVEIYGGAILNTWLDRPLSASGRVALRSDDVFHPRMCLVDFKKPFLTIPNLAIHMNREVNKGVELNRQTDMLPVFGLEDSEEFLTRLAEQLQVDREDILEYELGLYNTDTGDYLGLAEEFISSPRLDNLTSVQAITTAMIEGGRERGINVAAYFDHEEIGSRTKQGAGSTLLSTVLEKILLSLTENRAEFLETYGDSMLLSVDVAHGIHPNHTDKHDPTNQNVLGKGVCIKEACTQSYATDSEAVAIVQQICESRGISYQKFVNRSDIAGGSTLGSIASSVLPIRTVDIGVPLLAMHSGRELMGTADQESLRQLIQGFYSIS
ncbi:M18 family aminopeptidase [Candidatus Merdisoma sp. HCP28S3_D10]|uniref:M18 family aminopeptidase n=1 Tax=unclassified Candidatus Merdisoma TaxID=3099611 RepID=UPI003F889493